MYILFIQSSAPALSSVLSSGRTAAVVVAHVSIPGVAMVTCWSVLVRCYAACLAWGLARMISELLSDRFGLRFLARMLGNSHGLWCDGLLRHSS